MSVVSSSQPAQPGSLEMRGPTETLPRWNAGTAPPSNSSRGGRRGSLMSLKAYYRKLCTFKGTVRAVINIRRVPLLLAKIAEASSTLAESEGDDQRSAVSGVPRISTTATSRVQSHVHDLVAGGHVITELDPTSTEGVTYRQQGNLEHYTEDNIAKRLSLQKHPHMIALTQRLWSCALHDGETKLSFTGYETYMLCLHRLILPEFDLATSKELIQDDWARDCGRKEQLDYAYFHLSMFELVDLWTDTVDPEDYISLLYCIVHCLTFTVNNCHVLKPLEGVRSVNILEESKSMSSLGIEQDLQREMTSEAFEDYRNQVELATSTILEASKGSDQEERDDSGGEEGQKTEQPRRPSTSSGSRERKSSTADTDSNSRTKAMSLQSANGPATSRSGARGAADRKRSSGDARGAAVRNATAAKDAGNASQQSGAQRDSVSTVTPFTQESPKRKVSAQPKPSGLEFSMDASHAPLAGSPSSPRRDAGPKRENSTNAFTLGGGVILSVGAVDGLAISQSNTDGKSSASTMTMISSAFPRRRSRSASNASQQQRRELLLQASEKSMASPLQLTHPDSALRTSSQGPNASAYILIPTLDASPRHGRPFTIRAAAVAAAAATMAVSASPVNKQLTVNTQRPQQHQLSSQFNGDGFNATSVVPMTYPARHFEEALPSSLVANHISLTAPLMTNSSGKTPVDRDGLSSRRMTQHNADHRPPPYGISGSALASPQVDNVPMSLASAAVMSYRQGSVKPPTSPRQMIGTTSQRSGLVINLGNNYQSPMSSTDKRKYSGHSEGAGARSPARTGSNPSSPMMLAISGRTVTPNYGAVRTTTPYQQLENVSSMGLPDGILRGSALASPEAADVLAAVYSQNEPSRLSSSPQYILSNAAGTTPSAQPPPMSPTTPKHNKVSGMRPQESVRGFATGNGQHKSPRSHRHTLDIVTGPALSQLQQSQRQQRVLELQSLATTPLNLR